MSTRATAPPPCVASTRPSTPCPSTGPRTTRPARSGATWTELPDRTGDRDYLDALGPALDRAFADGRPDLVFYLAGADPYEHDRLGRLALTKEGLSERDRMVFDRCHAAGVPLVVTMAGGYAKDVADTVDIHWQTVERAIRATR